MIELNFDRQKLKTFIRDVLGCGCPEEVFEKMICQRETLGGIMGTSIDVGGRLLVFLTDKESAADASKVLEPILKAGKVRRDECGFNRFRLVLLTDKSETRAGALQRGFEEFCGKDEKVHLHVLHPATVPAFILETE